MSSLGKRSAGFTLTELIVVILLIAIMSAYAASKFSGPSQFSVYAAQEQAISVIRQIQLGRMQTNLSSTDLDYANKHAKYRLWIQSDCLSSSDGCTNNEVSSNSVLVTDQSFSFSPAMIIEFDLLGVPTCVTGCGGVTQVIPEITISNGVETLKVCINQEGFVNDCL